MEPFFIYNHCCGQTYIAEDVGLHSLNIDTDYLQQKYIVMDKDYSTGFFFVHVNVCKYTN